MELKRVVVAACILALLASAVVRAERNVFAQDSTRVTTILVSYTEYEWWLISWADNQIQCQLFIDHEGLPTVSEVASSCGDDLATEWFQSPLCKDLMGCRGLYVYLVASQPKQREVVIELPMPVVWVTLEGCTPVPPENLCAEIPMLVLTGEEPLPNESIIAIQGTFDGTPFVCPGEVCKLPLSPTPLLGSRVEFWANSSYGDSSEHFTAQVRVVDSGVSEEPGGGGWYVDVISSQWQGSPLASCAKIWEAFPPLGGPPAWLVTPEGSELLASEEPYYYLAGRLISQGLVDASGCPLGGLLPNGYADVCGLEVSRPLVEDWQNQFDTRIVNVARETGIPAQLMKNLFAQESQFWPGVFRVPYEYGLGQLTDKGADSILLWNPSFFDQICPLVLAEDACAGGYLNLNSDNQAILRGAVALQAKSDCPTCLEGIDLSNVNFSVLLFANMLQANCAQVSRTIYTATNKMAGTVSTYEDLWRLTIANYHAGPGCLSYAVHQAWTNSTTGQLTWDEVVPYFTDPCKGAVPYVEKITR